MASALKPVNEALHDILAALPNCGEEMVALQDAFGRSLAKDVIAGTHHPLANMSAMDGFAVRASDIKAGRPLHIIGESAAGHPFTSALSEGEAVRIYTGAYMPEGSDCVLLQEDALIDGDKVRTSEPINAGRFVRLKGQDFARDDVILPAGHLMTSRSIALCALALQSRVSVIKKPRIALLSSGDELVPMGALPRFGQLINSNSVFLAHILRKWGAEVTDLGILSDEQGALHKAIEDPSVFDLIITSGGASVGAHDHIVGDLTMNDKNALSFWKIAMRPGKPLISGKIDNTAFIGLPGNPVSVAICSLIFLMPMMAHFSKRDDLSLSFIDAISDSDLAENDQREDYLRGTAYQDDKGHWHIKAFNKQDSALLGRMARANAILIRKPFAPALAVGETVKMALLPEGF